MEPSLLSLKGRLGHHVLEAAVDTVHGTRGSARDGRTRMQRSRVQIPVIAPDLVVPIVEDDTEEAPWMVMGDTQFWATTHLATSLHHYAQVHGRPWYVASLLPIVYRRRGERRTRQVAPDVLVAFVPQRP